MKAETIQVVTPEQAEALSRYFVGLSPPFTVVVKDGLVRTNNQNALLHKWYGEISQQGGEWSADEVKGFCHHRWGLPIKLRDPQFNWIWRRTGDSMSYEQQCRLLASGVLNISSSMTTKELSDYMDAMAAHFRAQGVRLTEPKEKFDEPFEKAALGAKIGGPY